jgi:hypothetical protein
MLNDLQILPSQDPSRYVALRGRRGLITVNIRIPRTAIDDLPESGGHPTTVEQRTAFVSQNLDAIRVIADKKLKRGDAQPADWEERFVLDVNIDNRDFSEYLGDRANRLSYAAFSPGSTWADRSGRFE